MPAFAPSHAASPARPEASSPLLAQVDRIALEQLEWLLPLWSAQDPPAYRTLAAYSRYCARSHLSALPIQPVMALKYLRTQLCREEVSPYILSAVIAHLNRVYTDMADIFPENLPWRGETFEALVDEHRTTWERAEGDRKASLTEDKDEPTDDEAPNVHFSGRILRHRKPTQLAQSISDLPSKPRRDKLGKRTRSYLGNSETKRQKVDDGAPPSPRSAASLSDDQEQEEPKTRRREEEGRANPIHPLSAVRKGDEPPQPVHSYSEGPPPQRNAGFPPFDPQLHDDQRRGWDRAGPYHHPLPSRPPAWSAPFPAPPFPNFDPRFPGPPPSHRPPPHFQAPLSFPQMSAADYPPHFPTLPTRPLTPPIPKSPSLEPPPAPVIEPEPPKPPAPPPKRVSLSSLRAMIGARKTQETSAIEVVVAEPTEPALPPSPLLAPVIEEPAQPVSASMSLDGGEAIGDEVDGEAMDETVDGMPMVESPIQTIHPSRAALIIREEPEPSHREELPPRQRTMSSSTVASEHSRLPRHPMPQRPSAFAVRDDATPSRPRRQSVDRLRDTRQPPPPFASHPPRAHHDDFHPSSVPGRDEPPRQDQRFQPAPARAPLPPQAYDRREDAFTPRPDYRRPPQQAHPAYSMAPPPQSFPPTRQDYARDGSSSYGGAPYPPTGPPVPRPHDDPYSYQRGPPVHPGYYPPPGEVYPSYPPPSYSAPSPYDYRGPPPDERARYERGPPPQGEPRYGEQRPSYGPPGSKYEQERGYPPQRREEAYSYEPRYPPPSSHYDPRYPPHYPPSAAYDPRYPPAAPGPRYPPQQEVGRPVERERERDYPPLREGGDRYMPSEGRRDRSPPPRRRSPLPLDRSQPPRPASTYVRPLSASQTRPSRQSVATGGDFVAFGDFSDGEQAEVIVLSSDED